MISPMTSWRDSASSQSQADLDGLLSEVLPFAQQQLERRGDFFPYGATVSIEGDIRMTAADPGLGEWPGSQAVLDALYAGVRAARTTARAAAFVADVKLDGRDAIRVELEHAEGGAMTVFMPYSRGRLRKSISYEQLQAGGSESHIWSVG